MSAGFDIGGLVGGIGDFAGGIYDRFYQKSTDDKNRDMARNAFKNRVEDARKMGISPLAALGMGTVSPSASAGSSDLAAQGIGKIAGAFDKREAKRRAKLENELLEAQIGEVKARTNSIEGQKTGVGLQPGSTLEAALAKEQQDSVVVGSKRVKSMEMPFGGRLYRDPNSKYSPKVGEEMYNDASGFIDILRLLEDYVYTAKKAFGSEDRPQKGKKRKYDLEFHR